MLLEPLLYLRLRYVEALVQWWLLCSLPFLFVSVDLFS